MPADPRPELHRALVGALGDDVGDRAWLVVQGSLPALLQRDRELQERNAELAGRVAELQAAPLNLPALRAGLQAAIDEIDKLLA